MFSERQTLDMAFISRLRPRMSLPRVRAGAAYLQVIRVLTVEQPHPCLPRMGGVGVPSLVPSSDAGAPDSESLIGQHQRSGAHALCLHFNIAIN